MKRMRHPLHGWHHAADLNEELRMRANGWVDDVPPSPELPALDELQFERDRLDALGVKYDRRMGVAKLRALP